MRGGCRGASVAPVVPAPTLGAGEGSLRAPGVIAIAERGTGIYPPETPVAGRGWGHPRRLGAAGGVPSCRRSAAGGPSADREFL